MKFRPRPDLTEQQISSKLNLVILDGITSEVMAILSGGAFLVAFALLLGASNLQIGVMASVSTLASVFQLAAIYLIQRYKNRRAIVVYCAIIGRSALVLISMLPFIFSSETGLRLIIVLLFLHHTMGMIGGLCWMSWMKDLIPEKKLGDFFANRGRYTQIISVLVTLALAFGLDYVKQFHAAFEIEIYAGMFLMAAVVGLFGTYLLAKTPEPTIEMTNKNLREMFTIPFKNENFRNLMIFHSMWLFATNLAAPFFTVYLLNTLRYPLKYVIMLTILGQLSHILLVRVWGRYSDQYSNKTVLQICAPLYLLCILGWTFTTMPSTHIFTIPLLVVIHIVSGGTLAGINLALNNIGLKLAPKGDGVYYITAKSMISAVIAGLAPIAGGLFADYFFERSLTLDLKWNSPNGLTNFHTLDFTQWDFFFALSFLIGVISLYKLRNVKEEGEIDENIIMNDLFKEIKVLSTITGIKSVVTFPINLISGLKNRIKSNTED